MLYNLEMYSVLISSFQSWPSKSQRNFYGIKRRIQKTSGFTCKVSGGSDHCFGKRSLSSLAL